MELKKKKSRIEKKKKKQRTDCNINNEDVVEKFDNERITNDEPEEITVCVNRDISENKKMHIKV